MLIEADMLICSCRLIVFSNCAMMKCSIISRVIAKFVSYMMQIPLVLKEK